MKQVKINKKIYSLTSFADQFGFSYTTVYRYYQQGFRNRSLLKVVQKATQKSIKVNGIIFANRNQAANYYHIPNTTFYKWIQQGSDLNSKVKKYSCALTVGGFFHDTEKEKKREINNTYNRKGSSINNGAHI